MDPITVISLAKVYQQEILDSAAQDRWGHPLGRSRIMEHLNHETTAYLQQQAGRELFSLLQPTRWLRRLFTSLTSAARAAELRQANESVYADPCAAECE